jgi:acyl carrier protein
MEVILPVRFRTVNRFKDLPQVSSGGVIISKGKRSSFDQRINISRSAGGLIQLVLDRSAPKVTIGAGWQHIKSGGFLMADTYSEIKDVIVELLNVEPEKVTPEARFREDLEADSLDLVELIMAFEDKFGGEISDEDAQKITTVGEAVNYIDSHMK